ncbi:MAG: hypothetical protein IPK60_02275 [Sandaracinaceae bacterium]|nr:hypothetical protein [Sandaracinaceae bacterium]
MAKMHLLRVYQADPYSPLHLEGAFSEVSAEEQAADLQSDDVAGDTSSGNETA